MSLTQYQKDTAVWVGWSIADGGFVSPEEMAAFNDPKTGEELNKDWCGIREKDVDLFEACGLKLDTLEWDEAEITAAKAYYEYFFDRGIRKKSYRKAILTENQKDTAGYIGAKRAENWVKKWDGVLQAQDIAKLLEVRLRPGTPEWREALNMAETMFNLHVAHLRTPFDDDGE